MATAKLPSSRLAISCSYSASSVSCHRQRRAQPRHRSDLTIVHARIDDGSGPQQLTRERPLPFRWSPWLEVSIRPKRDCLWPLYVGDAAGSAQAPGAVQSAGQRHCAIQHEVLRSIRRVPQLAAHCDDRHGVPWEEDPKGAFVLLCWASGNRDPQRFADPDKFDMDRANLNHHTAFGTGPSLPWRAACPAGMKCAIARW